MPSENGILASVNSGDESCQLGKVDECKNETNSTTAKAISAAIVDDFRDLSAWIALDPADRKKIISDELRNDRPSRSGRVPKARGKCAPKRNKMKNFDDLWAKGSQSDGDSSQSFDLNRSRLRDSSWRKQMNEGDRFNSLYTLKLFLPKRLMTSMRAMLPAVCGGLVLGVNSTAAHGSIIHPAWSQTVGIETMCCRWRGEGSWPDDATPRQFRQFGRYDDFGSPSVTCVTWLESLGYDEGVDFELFIKSLSETSGEKYCYNCSCSLDDDMYRSKVIGLSAVYPLGAFVGSGLNFLLNLEDRLGMRATLMLSASMSTMAGIWKGLSEGQPAAGFGCFLSGLSVAQNMYYVVCYGEQLGMSPYTLTIVWQLSVAFGGLIPAFTAYALRYNDWGPAVGLSIEFFISPILLVVLFLLPETTNFYIDRDKLDEAFEIYHIMHLDKEERQDEELLLKLLDEFEAMVVVRKQIRPPVDSTEKKRKKKSNQVSRIPTGLTRIKISFVCLAVLAQQLTFFNGLFYCQPFWLQDYFEYESTLMTNVALTGITVISTLCSFLIIEWKRLLLLRLGSFVQIVSLFSAAVIAWVCGPTDEAAITLIGPCVGIFHLAYCASWGPVVIIMITELLMHDDYLHYYDFAQLTLWAFITLQTASFPLVSRTESIGPYSVVLFAIAALNVTPAVITLKLPETYQISFVPCEKDKERIRYREELRLARNEAKRQINFTPQGGARPIDTPMSKVDGRE